MSAYAQLSGEQIQSYALKVQREWHWLSYTPAQRREILARVQRLVAAQPQSYLAWYWREVYR